MNNGYTIVENVLNEKRDEEGVERSRVKRFGHRYMIGLKAGVRKLVMRFRIWLWPSYLWSDAVNVCKMLFRIGTGKNTDLRIDFMRLMQKASSGDFKTGKDFNHAIQDVMAKHKLRKQRLYDHVEQ